MPAPAQPLRGIILASASPRRSDLLRSAGLRFEVQASEIDESPLAGETPRAYARRMAAEKCQAVRSARQLAGDARPVLAADTVVVVGGEIMGKARDRAEARQMLRRLSGRSHEVITGFCLAAGPGAAGHAEEVTTEVRFRPLEAAEVEAYLDSGDWQDKAGAYAIQGGAAQMVLWVRGSYTNVVGLPLAEVVQALRALAPEVGG